MSERFEIKTITRKCGVPDYIHVIDTEMDNEIVHVAYAISDAEAYVREHAERPSLAEQDRIARMLAECAEVRETAERQIAEFTEIRDRALSVERRLRARQNRLNVLEGPDAPRTFLADLRRFATVQPCTSKPMPY